MGLAYSKLDPATVATLVECTHFERREIITWYDNFTKQHPDGYLTKETLCNTFLRYYPFGDPKPYVDLMFRLFTPKLVDSLDFQEFLAVVSVTSRGNLDEKLDWSFRFYDFDGDEKISLGDMEHAIEAVHALIGPSVHKVEGDVQTHLQATKLFAQMDGDKRGFIGRQEFKEAAKLDPTIVQALVLYDGIL